MRSRTGMFSVILNGSLGLISSLVIGMSVLDFTAGQVLWADLSACIAGMVGMLVILKGERTPWVRRHIFTRQARTWICFLALYFGLIFLLAPRVSPFNSVRSFLWLTFPMILSTGWTILAFGPIQDRIVARIQRKARAHAQTS